jgi:hypothetical protein
MVMAREYAMNQLFDDFPVKEFRATKSGSFGQILIFLGMAAGCAWLAYCSLTPDYWTDFGYYELEALGKFMSLFPVAVRVIICCALMLTCLNAARIKLERYTSDTPLLILSKEGVSGFKNGFAKDHTFINWGEFKKAIIYNKQVLHFKGKSANILGKSAIISINLSEIGVKYAGMVAAIDAYQMAWICSGGQSQTAQQNSARSSGIDTHRAAITRERESVPAPTQAKRPEPQAPQFMKPNVPDFGKRVTRL